MLLSLWTFFSFTAIVARHTRCLLSVKFSSLMRIAHPKILCVPEIVCQINHDWMKRAVTRMQTAFSICVLFDQFSPIIWPLFCERGHPESIFFAMQKLSRKHMNEHTETFLHFVSPRSYQISKPFCRIFADYKNSSGLSPWMRDNPFSRRLVWRYFLLSPLCVHHLWIPKRRWKVQISLKKWKKRNNEYKRWEWANDVDSSHRL